MAKAKKRLLALAAMLAVLVFMSTSAFAASASASLSIDEDIVLEVSTDKDSYSGGEEIKITLKVTNGSSVYGISKVTVQESFSDGIEEAEAGGLKNLGSIEKGASLEATGTYVGNTDVFGSGGLDTLTIIIIVVVAAVVVIVAVAVVVLVVLKKKKAKAPVAALLLIGAMGIVLSVGGVKASAESSSEPVVLKLEGVTCGGSDITLNFRLTVAYTDDAVSFATHADKKVTVTTASVHDPSIVVAADEDGNKTYYVFGSHRAVGVSTDLINWTQGSESYFGVLENGEAVSASYSEAFSESTYDGTVTVLTSDGTEAEVDFGSYDGEAWITANTADGTGLAGNMWAPDVVYNETMGKWCMYYSLNGPQWNSCIVLLTADEVTGPYVYVGPVMFTGFKEDADESVTLSYKNTDIELVLGELDELPSKYCNKLQVDSTGNVTGGSWGDSLPHAIDPCILYDDDGELWMSYGSWSGGIYMIKIDTETGLRDYTYTYTDNDLFADMTTDAYFGVKLAGGAYITGEASYIQKIDDYYYLWISYGGLTTAGGYNMRIYRSENIYGPYVDYNGNTGLATSWSDWYNSSKGVRLFGAYKWASMSQAEVAQGHNSAFVDDDGKAYVVYHTRFVTPNSTNQSEGHLVRVHQLVTTKGGWIVAAPFRYSGETVDYDNPSVTEDEWVGQVQIMIHELNVDYANYDYVEAVTCKFNADGTITGALTGTWELDADGKAYMTLVINDHTYDCVYFKQNVENYDIEVPVLTGIGDNQLTIWGYSIEGID